jgi:metal-responsive CopG/Arc/MetJ family transcriptional regulator
MKDVATRQVDEYIQNQKKRKQIFSITLDQELYDDAIQVADKNHNGNFSQCVTTALEEYIDKEVAKGLALVNDK